MDEDGYAVGDPYAEAAKMIDRKKKAEEASKTLKAKAAKTAKYIIENKEEVTKWEKLIKSCLCILGLFYMVIQSGAMTAEDAEYLPNSELLSQFGNQAVFIDFMKREGFALIFFGGGYYLLRKYNDKLDQVEYQ